MTSEVAIMNKLAVALAADSAVTTGQPGREKIFTGANKIFTLSKHAPVGVMIYGHVEHFGVPWEIIIKEFRKELGTRRRSKVADYASLFTSYIARDRIVNEYQQGLGVLIACSGTSNDLRINLEGQFGRRRYTSTQINSVLDSMENDLDNVDALAGFSDYTYRRFLSDYGGMVSEYLETDPFSILSIPLGSRARFKRVVHLHLISRMMSRLSTGVVIAGYGEDELFPTLYHMTVDGGLADRLRIMEEDPVDIARSNQTVYVNAFAQEDAVEAFMNGADDDYTEYLLEMVSGFIREHTREMLDEHTQFDDSTKRTILAMVGRSFPEVELAFGRELYRYSVEKYRDPIESVLRYAPKDELAHVAESFVNLTSLRKRVSGERETVSGPVDVAVISKGDGFVWIKRKHYFDLSLNPQFAPTYFEGESAHAE